jgi:hypothetical protein
MKSTAAGADEILDKLAALTSVDHAGAARSTTQKQ